MITLHRESDGQAFYLNIDCVGAITVGDFGEWRDITLVWEPGDTQSEAPWRVKETQEQVLALYYSARAYRARLADPASPTPKGAPDAHTEDDEGRSAAKGADA